MAEATGSDGNTATKVHTNVEEFTDDKGGSFSQLSDKTSINIFNSAFSTLFKTGRRVRKTTKTTTTVTIKGGKKTTSTKSEVTTEFVDGGSTSNKTEVKLGAASIFSGQEARTHEKAHIKRTTTHYAPLVFCKNHIYILSQ